MRYFLLLLVAYLFALPTQSFAQQCYQSSVLSPSPLLGNDGEIVKLADGTLWEVKYEYKYLYEYYPQVVICPTSGKMIVKNNAINVQPVSGRLAAGTAVIESIIISRFGGLNSGNIYRLGNGQIWEQTEAWAWAWTWANPSVVIYAVPGGFKMKVENIDHAVLVRRLK